MKFLCENVFYLFTIFKKLDFLPQKLFIVSCDLLQFVEYRAHYCDLLGCLVNNPSIKFCFYECSNSLSMKKGTKKKLQQFWNDSVTRLGLRPRNLTCLRCLTCNTFVKIRLSATSISFSFMTTRQLPLVIPSSVIYCAGWLTMRQTFQKCFSFFFFKTSNIIFPNLSMFWLHNVLNTNYD